MMCRSDEYKARMSALTAGWKYLAVDACHFVLFSMSGIMNNPIDAGMWNFIPRFEGITDVCHSSPCGQS